MVQFEAERLLDKLTTPVGAVANRTYKLSTHREPHHHLRFSALVCCLILLLAGCRATPPASATEDAPAVSSPEADEHEVLVLPKLPAVLLNGTRLNVVATTSIIGDIVAQVGGEQIALTTLIGPGQDPHSFEPGARDLTAAAEAHVIFVNGWDLEETLAHDLEAIGEGAPVVAVSAGIVPLPFGGDHEHDADEQAEHEEGEDHEHDADGHADHDEGEDHEHDADEHVHVGVDPHVWFNVNNVERWVENVLNVLSSLDPANAQFFEANASAYLAELSQLDEGIRTALADIPPEKRILVTNHDSLGYFADAYGFEVLATIIPGGGTLAEPSASDLAELIHAMESHDLCTIFSESTVSDTLAQTVADELDGCDQVQVLQLYTGSLGPVGSDADTYLGMFQTNVDTIVAGLH